MTRAMKIAGIALAMSLAACGGETAANGGGAEGQTVAAEADTSRNWGEVVERTDEGGFRMGNPDAPIKIVEYASLTCPHCAEFSETAMDPLREQYVSQGLVSIELRNFVRDPLDLSAALLARCRGPEAYFQITDTVFEHQTEMFESVQGADQARLQQLQTQEAVQSGEAFVGFAELGGLIDLVGGLGVPEQQARQCLTDAAAIQQLDEMRNRAVSQYNLAGTPTFLINGEVAQNVTTWAQLEARLQEMLG